MKTDSAYLHHILDSIIKIEKFILGYDKESFIADEKTVDATLMQLEVIGESSNRLAEFS